MRSTEETKVLFPLILILKITKSSVFIKPKRYIIEKLSVKSMAWAATLGFSYAKIIKISVAIFVGGFVITMIQLNGFPIIPGGDPAATFGFTVLLTTLTICCGATIMTTTYASRIGNYQEEENFYEIGKQHYDNGEWQEALNIFNQLLDPDWDHRRSLYYGARCYEKLGDWEGMKRFCKKYLELQSKDKEVWEMLGRAHKHLFEYEDADIALERASRLR